MSSAQVILTEDRQVDEMLALLPQAVREKYLIKGLRKEGNRIKRIARQLCPRGAVTGTTRRLSQRSRARRGNAKPLRDTIGVVVRDYGGVLVMLVGPQYPAGAHAHLVEYGHAAVLWGEKTSGRVPPKPFMRPAITEVERERGQGITDEIVRGVLQELGT